MKSNLALMTALCILSIAACSDDTTTPPKADAAPQKKDAAQVDSTVPKVDATATDTTIAADVTSKKDSTSGGCKKVATWPGIKPVGKYVSVGTVTYVESRQADVSPFTMLRLEDFHFKPDTHPKTVNATAALKTIDCPLCAYVAEGCTSDFASCKKVFFVQAGTITVTQADKKDPGGTMKATVANLKLVEWDEINDKAVAGGGCWEVGAGSFNVNW